MKCYHCGEECLNDNLVFDKKHFCCTGCKTVYDLLHYNKLYKYYDLNESPGQKSIESDFSGKYAYLDKENIQKSLIDFKSDNYSRVNFYIPDIHCSSCIWLLENLSKLNREILHSQVHFSKKEVTISFNHTNISLRQVVEILDSIHYKPDLNFKLTDEPQRIKSNKKLIYQLGIAGFCFGNIMLFSFPEYFSRHTGIDPEYKMFFIYINLILSVPVVFYSGADYLIAAVKGLKRKVISIDLPIAIGIVTIFFQSIFDVLINQHPGYFDSVSGLIFFLLIGKWYQNKTYQALSFERDYKSYFPIAITKLQQGNEIQVPINELKKDDLILIRNNELIPTDSELIEGYANIDYSFVTGESYLNNKSKGEKLYAGGRQVGNIIKLKVQNPVNESYFTQLWKSQESTTKEKSSLPNLIDRIAAYFTLSVLIIAAFTLIYWLLVNPLLAVKAFTSVLIIACPCALALSMPFALGTAMRLVEEKGFYLRSSSIIEKLTKITHVVFDKTGTLTYPLTDSIIYEGNDLSVKEKELLSSAIRSSTHPLSLSLNKYLKVKTEISMDKFIEYPGLGIEAEFHGQKLKIGSQNFIDPNTKDKSNRTEVFVKINDLEKGKFIIQNKYRKGIEILFSKINRNYQTHVLSGDNDNELKNILNLGIEKQNVHFNQKPEDKLNYLKKIQRINAKAMMIGDGLNDAGALSHSYVGVAVSEDVFHFVPSCDIILKANSITKIDYLLSLAHKSLNIVKISFVISFLYNVVGIYFASKAILSPLVAAILMPLSSVTVVFFVSAGVLVLNKILKINRFG